jgi:hypothetical protein
MPLVATLALALGILAPQNSTPQQPANPPARHSFPKPKATAAPGGGPDKVWVNTTTRVYHCYGDRYYGKTANGKYMTEKDAIALGAHGSRNEKCSAR